jgi:hypothetical protein
VAKTREVYILTGQTLEAVKTQLNGLLARLADRVDKLEGLRGELETQSGTFDGDITADGSDVLVNDEDGQRIHSME